MENEIIDKTSAETKTNSSKEGEMHSEIYGVSKGHVYERSTPSKNTTTNKKEEPKKVETKKNNIGTKTSDVGKKNVKKSSNINDKYNKGRTGKK